MHRVSMIVLVSAVILISTARCDPVEDDGSQALTLCGRAARAARDDLKPSALGQACPPHVVRRLAAGGGPCAAHAASKSHKACATAHSGCSPAIIVELVDCFNANASAPFQIVASTSVDEVTDVFAVPKRTTKARDCSMLQHDLDRKRRDISLLERLLKEANSIDPMLLDAQEWLQHFVIAVLDWASLHQRALAWGVALALVFFLFRWLLFDGRCVALERNIRESLAGYPHHEAVALLFLRQSSRALVVSRLNRRLRALGLSLCVAGSVLAAFKLVAILFDSAFGGLLGTTLWIVTAGNEQPIKLLVATVLLIAMLSFPMHALYRALVELWRPCPVEKQLDDGFAVLRHSINVQQQRQQNSINRIAQ